MQVSRANGKLTIVIDENSELALSKSGKSLVVASTNGNAVTNVIVNGTPLRVGVNAFIPAPSAPAANNGGGEKKSK